jgi:hypothetical protein
LALDQNLTFREMSKSKPVIAQLKEMLVKQGMELTMYDFSKPAYAGHKDYPGLLAAASMSMTSGDKSNDKFDLDGDSNQLSFLYKMQALKRIHPAYFQGNPFEAIPGISDEEAKKKPISLDQAAYMIALTSALPARPDTALRRLKEKGWLKDTSLSTISDPAKLTNGDVFMLIRDVVEYNAGVKYE